MDTHEKDRAPEKRPVDWNQELSGAGVLIWCLIGVIVMFAVAGWFGWLILDDAFHGQLGHLIGEFFGKTWGLFGTWF